MESVRAAVAGDAEQVALLAGALIHEVADRRGGQELVGSAAAPGDGWSARVRHLTDEPATLLLVGTLDDAVMGFALCHWDNGDVPSGRRGVLDACYVEPGARCVGVGRLLVDSAVAWLADQGCRGVDGVALPGDRGAKSFFESSGFKARLITMYRPLG